MSIISKVLLALILLTALSVSEPFSIEPADFRGAPFIWITILENKSFGELYYMDEYGEIVYSTRISSGSSNFQTPSGVHRVYFKKRYHMSTKYPEDSGVNNMNFSLFFKGGFAIHKGNPRMSSHGCVHVAGYEANILYTDSYSGIPVVITRVKSIPKSIEEYRLRRTLKRRSK